MDNNMLKNLQKTRLIYLFCATNKRYKTQLQFCQISLKKQLKRY